MSQKSNLFTGIELLPYFSRSQINANMNKFNISDANSNYHMSQAIKNRSILRIKRDLYISKEIFIANRNKDAFLFYLSNVALRPSYISLETALDYYGMFAEAIGESITAVTTKLPRVFNSQVVRFSYRKIRAELFSDFQIFTINGFEFAIAKKYKALFDYLYYQTDQFTKNLYPELIEDLRIDTSLLTRREIAKLRSMLAKYTSVKFYI